MHDNTVNPQTGLPLRGVVDAGPPPAPRWTRPVTLALGYLVLVLVAAIVLGLLTWVAVVVWGNAVTAWN